MKKLLFGCIALLMVILISCDQAKDVSSEVRVKDSPSGGGPFSSEEYQQIVRDGEDSLARGPWSVIDKKAVAVSGDIHDYYSIGYYFWPNPNTSDGLPYIEKDGQANKDNGLDRESMNKMISTVRKLSLCYHMTGEERYAERAIYLIEVWFLNEKTRMNPHLSYAQAIPGKNNGRPTGIIDTWELPDVLRGVGLLRKSPAWTPQKQEGLVAWFSSYLDWLLKSDFGRSEAASKNNHATWYWAQVSVYATFAGRSQDIREILEKSIPPLLQGQIAEDGSQPLELKRTRSLHYSIFNIIAWLDIVEFASQTGITSFAKDSDNSQRLLKAISYVRDNTASGKTWPYPEITETPLATLYPVFLKTSLYFDDASFEVAAKALPQGSPNSRRLFEIATLSVFPKQSAAK